MLIAELAAGGLDVRPHLAPHRDRQMMRREIVLEPVDACGRRAQQMTLSHRIDGDEIDAGQLAAQ